VLKIEGNCGINRSARNTQHIEITEVEVEHTSSTSSSFTMTRQATAINVSVNATTHQPEALSLVSGSNSTSDSDEARSAVWHAVVIVAYSSLIVVSVAGNGIVVMAVVTCRRMRTVTNYLIVSLAGADLMMAVLSTL